MASDDEQPGDDVDADDAPFEAAIGPGGDPVDGLTDLLGGLSGADGGGGLDLGGLLQTAMDMQQQLVAAQDELAATVVTGRAGGGAVEIDVTGGLSFLDVRIRPDAVDPDDVEMLQDLVLAALHDATRAIGDLQQTSAPDLGGMGGGLPDLGALGADPFAALGGLGTGTEPPGGAADELDEGEG